MATVPGPRTSPTIKPLSSMNKSSLRSWEVRLGMIQVVVLLGLITGSVACAFYLGFFSGQRSGFDNALAKSLANMPKVPVVPADKIDEEARQRLSSQLYAKLEEPMSPSLALREKDDVPALGVIPSTDEKPLPDLVDEMVPRSKDTNEKTVGSETLARMNTFGSDARDVSDENDATLGSVSPERDMRLEATRAVAQQGTPAEREQIDNSQSATSVRKESTSVQSPVVTTTTARSIVAKPTQEKPKVLASWSEGGSKVNAKGAGVQEERKQPPALLKQVIPSGWFAQVAAPKKIEDARQLATKLKSSGFQVVVETADVRGEEYYRVLVGPEDGRKEAQRMVEQLKRESYIRGEPFLKLVK